MKYFIYCRKSTDEDNRQIQSIQAQETELMEFVKNNKLQVYKVIRESKTAKEPGRELFNQMLLELEQGKAQGIISWHPDRLARNSIDGGKIIYLMDTGIIQDLKFPTYWVDNTPQGKFTLSLAFGQSKYYIDNLSQNVKRGIREKLRRGEYPSKAYLGYLNDLVDKKIVPDPVRFGLVKRLFDEYAKNIYSLQELADEAYSWGLVGKKGKKLSKSVLQRILQNTFYCGIITYNRKRYTGIHKKMITMGTFLQVQKTLKNKSKPTYFKTEKKNFMFTGLMTCGECGCAITAETKKGHVYYRCTKKKGVCTQKYVREEALESQIAKVLDQISIDDKVRDLLLNSLKQTNEIEFDTHINSLKYWQNEQNKLQEKKKRLLNLYTDGKITETEFEEKRLELDTEENIATDNLEACKEAGDQWVEQFENFVIVANQAFYALSKGNSNDRKSLLNTVGSNFVLKDKNLHWDWVQPFDILAENADRSEWRRVRDSNP